MPHNSKYAQSLGNSTITPKAMQLVLALSDYKRLSSFKMASKMA